VSGYLNFFPVDKVQIRPVRTAGADS